MEKVLDFIPEEYKPLGAALILLVAMITVYRKISLERRHRVHELSRDKAILEILKLKYEAATLWHRLEKSIASASQQSALAGGSLLPEPQSVFAQLTDSSALAQPTVATLPTRRLKAWRALYGFLGAVPVAAIAAASAWENDPGPTAAFFLTWMLIGVISAVLFGGGTRWRSVAVALIGPFIFSALLTVLDLLVGLGGD